MRFCAIEPVAGPELRDGRNRLVLKLASAFGVAGVVRQSPQVFAHERADGRVVFRSLDARATIHVVWK